MSDLNITKYKKVKGQDIVYYGSAKVKKGFYFVDGDESFYHFIGKNSVYSLLELLHPDDVNGVYDAIEKMSEGQQHVIARMRCYNDTYRCLYMTLRLNGRMYGEFESFTIEFCDVMEIKDRYETYEELVIKYRGFMTLSSLLYWEYRYADDRFILYHYVNVKSQTLLSKPLEQIREEVTGSEEFMPCAKLEFDTFYQTIQKGIEQFSAKVDARMLIPEESEEVQYKIKGSTMYRKGERYMAFGIAEVCGKPQKATSYYLTEGAIDPGTGLFNKRAINEYAMEQIMLHKPGKRGIYLAIVDVDDFKKINDTYGHMFGDEVLSKISEIMRTVLTSRGVVGRFGGDEFMVVIDGVDGEDMLRRIIKTICKHIAWEYEELQSKLKITTSWGIAKYPDDAANFEELFQKADKALYIAKDKGKNRLIIYDEKKHGKLASKEDMRDSGAKTIASDEKKASVVTDLVMNLHQNGRYAFEETMETMCAYFDVDGMAIYKGEDMKRSCSYGKYVNPIRSIPQIKEEQYLEFFDEQGVYESNMQRLSNSFSEIYQLHTAQENGKFIHCIAVEDGVPTAMVAFDFFNRYPKIGVTDMGLMKIVGKLMAEIAGKDE